MIAAAATPGVNWPLIWTAVTAIATCALFVGIPVSVYALISEQRADREAHRKAEARRWDANLSAACTRFLQSQSTMMRLARRARLTGERIENLDSVRENFESTFIEFELLAPNQLVESAQILWAQTVGTVIEEGFSERWPASYADDQRRAFLEQVRTYFGLPELYKNSAEVIRRVSERNKRPDRRGSESAN
jgi:hypothetical protein